MDPFRSRIVNHEDTYDTDKVIRDDKTGWRRRQTRVGYGHTYTARETHTQQEGSCVLRDQTRPARGEQGMGERRRFMVVTRTRHEGVEHRPIAEQTEEWKRGGQAKTWEGQGRLVYQSIYVRLTSNISTEPRGARDSGETKIIPGDYTVSSGTLRGCGGWWTAEEGEGKAGEAIGGGLGL
ncbi:hypothetical protein C8Q80DRAFT_809347 [Daedaleopsis nitida]|nr:hypothetical protein C8Q80DRAFT_809347 [Daedaleopsis nitida]